MDWSAGSRPVEERAFIENTERKKGILKHRKPNKTT
jgi:hypothetical protein